MARDGALGPGDLVAVTGASGFVGAHVVAAALRHGLRVRAVVRDARDRDKREPVRRLLELLDVRGLDRLEFASGDLLTPGSYDDALAGCAGVAHVAAVARFAARDPQREIVDPSLRGVENVYAAARRAGTVRRIAHTSSVSAIMRPADARRGHRFTAADWNTESALKTDAYGYAKTAAERRAWELVAALPEAERFGLVVLNPAVVFGRVAAKAHVRTSPLILRDLLIGTYPAVPALHFGFVDAEDVAEAHVQALLRPEAAGKRVILCAEQAWLRDLAERLRRLYPDAKVPRRAAPDWLMKLAARFDGRINGPMLDMLLGCEIRYDGAPAQALLGIRYGDFDETLRRTAQSMLDNGWARPRRR